MVAQPITHYHCTYWVGATTIVMALLSLPSVKEYDFSSFPSVISGGAPISVELQKEGEIIFMRATQLIAHSHDTQGRCWAL